MSSKFKILGKKIIHNGFFKMNEITLKYQKYDGNWSNEIKRELFGGAQVSAVLPYDPDNKKIVVAAKAGKSDVLHIINVKTKKSEKYELNIDGVFSASWSPRGNEIAFVGQKGNSSDIYIFDIKARSTG